VNELGYSLLHETLNPPKKTVGEVGNIFGDVEVIVK